MITKIIERCQSSIFKKIL